MAGVMNRAARRASKASAPKAEIKVSVVPMELVELYYRTQIASEGYLNAEPAVIVTRPQAGLLRADDAWFFQTLDEMRAVRRHGTNRTVFPAGPGRAAIDVDIGLIDVQVFFNAYDGIHAGSPRTEENFSRFRRICGGEAHDQMVMATAVHHFRPDGSLLLHYHNLVFALRKQVDPDVHIGLLDLTPLVRAIGNNHRLHVLDDDHREQDGSPRSLHAELDPLAKSNDWHIMPTRSLTG